MTNVNKKITLLICLVLSLLMIFVLSSCDNGETPADSSTNTGNSSTNTDTSTDSSTDIGTDDNTPDVPTDCIIEEAEGFDFDTTGTTPKIYKNVSNSTEIIDLSGSITVTEGCTWRMYKDFLGEDEYKLKSMSLAIGENKAYIVVYHPDGETFTRYELVLYRLDMKDYSFISDNVPYENGTIEELSSVEAPTTNPQKTGYDFMGWTVNGEFVSFPYQVNVDTVFEAEFAPIEYEIEYNLNGGANNAENPLKYTIEESVALLAPTRDFYTFDGWYESDNFEGNAITEIAESSYGKKTFYANWRPITYDINYVLNGGTNDAENPSIYNTEISVELKAPTKAGYTFAGWFADKDFSVETTGISLGEGNAKTFYAKWNANENTIVFNANGGSGSMPNMTVATDCTVKLTTYAFTRNGYTFKGWATSANGGVVYADEASYTMGTEESYTLYAVWEANKNTLVFNANGGNGSMLNMTIATDSTVKLTTNAFEKAGYTFMGWATSASGSVEYTDGASYTMGTNSTYTLYAIWQVNINGVVFNANGGKGTMSSLELATGITDTLPKNTFTKDGYTFKGWATTKDGSVAYVDGASYTMGTNSTYTLYAVWDANKNTLVFDANGGSGSMSNMTIATDITTKLTSNAFTRNGYTFKGWATSKNGSVAYTNGASYTMGTNSSYTLYAVWQVNTYNITYVLNGGTNNTNSTTYTVEQEFAFKAPTKTGYTFDGWYNDSTLNSKVTGISLGTTGNKTFYAKWTANENTLVFNANGGSGSMSNMTVATDSTAKLTSNAFTKAGYTFKGWATSKGGSVVYTDGASYTMGTNSSYTLYAVWEANNNTLVFNANGGTGSMPNMTIATDSTAKLTSNAFTKDGYTFIGWAISKDGSVKYSNGASYTMGTESTYTLYAVWEKNINGLIFNGNGATSGSMSSVEIATGDTVSIPNNSFIRNGYTFIGWSTSANGSVVYTNGASYTMGTGSTYVLYAVWQANENTIVFNGNGATSGSMSSMTVKTDETATLSSNKFAKTGYTFKGWATTANGTVAYKNGASYTMGTDSVYTLYAVWEANLNTIIFNGNGATGGSTQNMTVATDSTATLNSNGFVRAGYTFRGWSTTKDGSIKYSNGGSYTMGTDSTYTLYAVWRANENTLVFNGNGATSGSTPSMTIATDDTAILTQNGFVRDGYTFVGWSTSASGSVKYTDGASYTMGTSTQYTLYAVWEAKENTLVFDGNGATSGSMSDMIIATDNTDILLNNKFAKTGYTFKGWSSTKNGSVEYQNGSAYTMGAESVATLYAVWEANKNTIVFNGNGATGGSMVNMTVATDSTVALTNNLYTKTGYHFIGWSTTKDGSVVYTNGASYTMGTNSSYILYAIWEANENTLVFNANSGLGNMSNMTISTDETVNLTSNKFVKAGYTFIGWATSANGGVVYENGASYKMGTNSSYTLYAVWQANENTIVFDGNEATSGSMSNMTVATDETIKLSSNGYKKLGYTFKGWSTTKGGSVEYADGASYTMDTSETYTLYAVWEMDTYKIDYVLNGGTNDNSNPTEYNIYSSIASFADATREHYIFNGWFTDSSFENSFTSIEAGSTGDITIYAKWEAVKYTITYETNDGTLDDSAATEFTVEDLPLALEKSYKKDYSFVGWCLNLNLEDEANLQITLAQNTNLYAKYEYGTEGLVYTTSGTGYEVTGYNGVETDVIIPETHNSLPVVSIKSYAFKGKSSLISITIPNNVETIGNDAFRECININSITLPFVGKSRSSDSIEETLGYIFGTSWYSGSVKVYTGIDNASTGPIYQYIPESLKNITIKGTVEKISDHAFQDCTMLTNVTIESNVTIIGTSAFKNCTALTSIIIPDSVTSIGSYAFSGCTSFKSITIPNSVTSIGSYAFSDCTSLTIYCEATSKPSDWNYYWKDLNRPVVWGVKNSGTTEAGLKWALNSSDEIIIADYTGSSATVEIPSVVNGCAVTRIGDYAFENCTSLTSITIPDSVTSIGWKAFYRCTSLTSVTIENSVETIEDYAFYECTSLTSVTIPDSVTSIGYRAFYNCNSLTSVTFENPNGWWYSESSIAIGGTSISSTNLSNTSTAAEYLTSTYYNYYWKRS